MKDSWLDGRVVEYFSELGSADVGAADASDQALLDELLQGEPCLVIGGLFLLDHAWLVGVVPAGWVPDLEWHELDVHWEVNQIQVEVVQLQVSQSLLQSWLHVLLLVVGIPKLRSHEQVLSLDKAVVEGSLDTLTDFLLIAVVTGSVQASVTDLNGVVDDLGDDVSGDLPET